jgi:hypothetical protein
MSSRPSENPQRGPQQAQHPDGRIRLADDAPEVNLSLFVVENKGIEISDDPIQGRIMVATRDFNQINEAILREAPALVCEQQDYLGFMERFLDLPVEVQVGILDLYFQPLDSPMGKALVEPAELLYVLGVLDDFTVIHQLLSIYMTNAYQYRHTKSAVTLFGSKFSHSCNPNVGYSSQSGLMEYRVLKPIRKGEQVAFSYLADLYETATDERRQLLKATKTFVCRCERCVGLDYSRCIQCPTCSDIVPCQYVNNNSSDNSEEIPTTDDAPYWECPTCGMLETSHMLKIEQVIENLLQAIETDVQKNARQEGFAKRSQFSPKILQDMVRRCQTKLSLTHHLTVKALRLWVNVATNHAHAETARSLMAQGQQQQQRNRSVPNNGTTIHNTKTRIHSLLRSTVNAGFQLVLACECVAADCKGCYLDNDDDDNDGSRNRDTKSPRLRIAHNPHYDRATPMNHFCEDLLQLPIYWWPPLAVTMVERYFPLLKSKFHKVDLIQQCLEKFWPATACLECGTYWQTPRWEDVTS